MDGIRKFFGFKRGAGAAAQGYLSARASTTTLRSIDGPLKNSTSEFVRALQSQGVEFLIINDGFLQPKEGQTSLQQEAERADQHDLLQALLRDVQGSSISVAVIYGTGKCAFDNLGLDKAELAGNNNFLGTFKYKRNEEDSHSHNAAKEKTIISALSHRRESSADRLSIFLYDKIATITMLTQPDRALSRAGISICEANHIMESCVAGLSKGSLDRITGELNRLERREGAPAMPSTAAASPTAARAAIANTHGQPSLN